MSDAAKIALWSMAVAAFAAAMVCAVIMFAHWHYRDLNHDWTCANHGGVHQNIGASGGGVFCNDGYAL